MERQPRASLNRPAALVGAAPGYRSRVGNSGSAGRGRRSQALATNCASTRHAPQSNVGRRSGIGAVGSSGTHPELPLSCRHVADETSRHGTQCRIIRDHWSTPEAWTVQHSRIPVLTLQHSHLTSAKPPSAVRLRSPPPSLSSCTWPFPTSHRAPCCRTEADNAADVVTTGTSVSGPRPAPCRCTIPRGWPRGLRIAGVCAGMERYAMCAQSRCPSDRREGLLRQRMP